MRQARHSRGTSEAHVWLAEGNDRRRDPHEHGSSGRRFLGPGGPLHSCTATLIGSRAILTAALCFDWQSDPTASATGWTFEFAGFTNSRQILGYVSLTSNKSDANTDIAVAALDRDIDPNAEGVFWSELATQYPDDSAQVHWYGYGCGDYATDSRGIHTCDEDSDYTSKRDLYVGWWALADDFALSTEDHDDELRDTWRLGRTALERRLRHRCQLTHGRLHQRRRDTHTRSFRKRGG